MNKTIPSVPVGGEESPNQMGCFFSLKKGCVWWFTGEIFKDLLIWLSKATVLTKKKMKTRTLASVSAKGAAPQLHICNIGRGIGNACHLPTSQHSPGFLYRRLLTKASSRRLLRCCSDTGKACCSISDEMGGPWLVRISVWPCLTSFGWMTFPCLFRHRLSDHEGSVEEFFGRTNWT